MMKRNAREGGIRSRLVAVTAAAALLVASVATGTAVAADDVPEETQPQVAAQTLDAVRNDDATPGDAVDSGDQTDAAVQNGGDAGTVGGDGSDNDAAANDDEPADGGAADGENADKQTAVDGNAAADDRDADGGSSDDVTPDTGATVSARTEDHTVAGVSPLGTTINLFDYDNGGTNGNINDKRVLHFGGGITSRYDAKLDKNNVNAWTGAKGSMKPAPRQGIVQKKLGSDGYPTLVNVLDGSSLKYLFNGEINGESVPGKTSYIGVDGLLQIDDGYYYYNSQDNFAQFNSDGKGSGSFTLYDTWGVTPVGTSPNGQFFPFNTGDQVFEEQDGKLVQKSGLNSGNNSIFNHYFGLSMSTHFVQQYGGHVDQNKEKPVTYNFSGDDDVWVYIDGVLVGDLGGIHDQVSLQINFATGEVVVYSDGRIDNRSDNIFNSGDAIDGTDPNFTAEQIGNAIDRGQDVYWQKTTLKDLFQKADVNISGWTSNTLPDNTYHKLDFFYMERGGSDSNMALRYNLVSIPETGIVKIDQDGNSISNVKFTLQQANKQADGDYQSVENGMTVTGTTDANGDLILTHENVGGATGTPYSLDELGDVSRYWILTEDNTPAGYRGVQAVHLYFAYGRPGNENLGTGPLLVDNQWDTGAYSAPHVTVQADATVHGTTTNKNYNLGEGGTMFAVVMKKVDNGWHPVSGDAFEGWTVHNSGDNQKDIIDAAKANPYIFTPGTNGSFEVTIKDLPGDIKTYRHMIQKYQGKTYNEAMAAAEYSVAYFYTAGDLSADSTVTSDNTEQISSEGTENSRAFDRIFSVTLNVPNIKNELKLRKTDVTDPNAVTAMEGVEFKLYVDENKNGIADSGSEPNTLTTDKNGVLQVWSGKNDTGEKNILAEGSYVLVETTPRGYVDESTRIQIIVDDEGVHVNAGTAEDNVRVETGIGKLVYSMKGFAAGDQVDATLHDVKARAQSAAAYDGADTEWELVTGTSESHFQYDKGAKDLSYTLNTSVENNGTATYIANDGWSRLNLQQCMTHSGDSATGPKQEITSSINHLFTGDVTILVTNRLRQSKGALVIQKQLDGRDWLDSDEFKFTVVPSDDDDVNGTADGVTTTEGAIASGHVVLPKLNVDGTDVALGTTEHPVIIDKDSSVVYGGSLLNHAVTYGDIVFKQAGTYTFTVSEQHGGDANLNYSDVTFTVTFTVNDENLNENSVPGMSISMSPSDAEDGVVLTNDDDKKTPYGVKFVNSLMKVSSLPLTGDDMTARNLLLAGGGVLLLAGAAWLLARRRRV